MIWRARSDFMRVTTAFGIVLLLGSTHARADDIKNWAFVCTRHIIGRIDALVRAGDISEAMAVSDAAGSLCGDPIPDGARSILMFDNGNYVSLMISHDGNSRYIVSDRWTPKWNLTTGKGEIAARREVEQQTNKMLEDDWAKTLTKICSVQTDAKLHAMCMAQPRLK